MKQTTAILSLLLLTVLISCSENAGYQQTKTGLRYKFVEKGSGPVVQPGQFIKFHSSEVIGDTTVGNSGPMPSYLKVDSVGDVYNPIAILTMLRKGDSCNIVMELDSLIKDPSMFPPFAKPGDKYIVSIRALEIFDSEEAINADREKVIEELNAREVEELNAYFQKENIQPLKSANGSYYVITEEGTGPLIDSGKTVEINYTGKTLAGETFDSSVDSAFNHPTPFVFEIGRGMVVKGWDDALLNFKKGSKGFLYIPSSQGYGAYPPPGSPFKGFESLVFEVEVLDVRESK